MPTNPLMKLIERFEVSNIQLRARHFDSGEGKDIQRARAVAL